MSEAEKRRKGYQLTIIVLMVIIIALLIGLIFMFANGGITQTVVAPTTSSSSEVSSSEPISSSSSKPEPSSSSEPEQSSSSESSSVAPPPPPPPAPPPVYIPPTPPAPPPPVYLPPVEPMQPTSMEITQSGLYDETGIYETIVIKKSGVTLKNKTINGDLYITEDIGKQGSVTLDNVIVDGELYILGGSENSIKINDCSISRMTIQHKTNTIGITVTGKTDVGTVNLKSDAILDEDDLNYKFNGFTRINVISSAPLWYEIDLCNTRINELLVSAPANINISSDGGVKDATVSATAHFSGYGIIDVLRVKSNKISLETRPNSVVNPKDKYEHPTYGETPIGA